MKKSDIKSVFFGTSTFSLYVLASLKKAQLAPTLIVTAPDRPQGRKLVLTSPPVKTWAAENNIDYVQPENIDAAFIAELRNTEWEIFMTASYGKILPKEVLDIPHYGALNVHPSLLPKYRGPSPIQSQILNDDRETGVTIMQMDEKMDHGPILTQARIEIEEEDWPLFADDLEELLGVEGGTLLAETIVPWIQGELTPEAQNETAATYTKKIEKADGCIDLKRGNPRENYLKLHAYKNWPGLFFFTEKSGKQVRVKITKAEFSNGVFTPLRVVPEGKKEIDYTVFLRG